MNNNLIIPKVHIHLCVPLEKREHTPCISKLNCSIKHICGMYLKNNATIWYQIHIWPLPNGNIPLTSHATHQKTILRKEPGPLLYIRIEHLRTDHDYTQTYVAKFLGINRNVYRRYEKGYRDIPVECLMGLADLYGTSVDYIIGRTNTKSPYTRAIRI